MLDHRTTELFRCIFEFLDRDEPGTHTQDCLTPEGQKAIERLAEDAGVSGVERLATIKWLAESRAARCYLASLLGPDPTRETSPEAL